MHIKPWMEAFTTKRKIAQELRDAYNRGRQEVQGDVKRALGIE
jgi:hypothetical protein